jgi:hypothetical protein
MGIWILDGDVVGMDRAVLLDSETERPLDLQAFEHREQAESFVAFVETQAVGLPLQRHDRESLERLREAWQALPKCQQCGERVVHPGELPNECETCRPPCDWIAGGETCNARGTEVIKNPRIGLDRFCAYHAALVRKRLAAERGAPRPERG